MSDISEARYDAENKRMHRTLTFLILGIFLSICIIAFALTYFNLQPSKNPRCPGVTNFLPGETITISCPSIH